MPEVDRYCAAGRSGSLIGHRFYRYGILGPMPAAAYGVLAVFTAMSIAAGVVSSWTTGPRRRWAPVLPTLAAFGTLYVVGHGLGMSLGPQVRLFGFEVSLLFDTAVAVSAAFVAAGLQAVAARLLQAQKRSASGDRLA